MFSETTLLYLTDNDLHLLQKVLSDCGYTADIKKTQSASANIAARLLIRLYQGGMMEPKELSDELARHFGRTKSVMPPAAERQLHKDAIRGLYPPGHAGRRIPVPESKSARP